MVLLMPPCVLSIESKTSSGRGFARALSWVCRDRPPRCFAACQLRLMLLMRLSGDYAGGVLVGVEMLVLDGLAVFMGCSGCAEAQPEGLALFKGVVGCTQSKSERYAAFKGCSQQSGGLAFYTGCAETGSKRTAVTSCEGFGQ